VSEGYRAVEHTAEMAKGHYRQSDYCTLMRMIASNGY